MKLTPVVERLAGNCNSLFLRLRSVAAGIRISNTAGGICQTSLVPLEIVEIDETFGLLKNSVVIYGGISLYNAPIIHICVHCGICFLIIPILSDCKRGMHVPE